MHLIPLYPAINTPHCPGGKEVYSFPQSCSLHQCTEHPVEGIGALCRSFIHSSPPSPVLVKSLEWAEVEVSDSLACGPSPDPNDLLGLTAPEQKGPTLPGPPLYAQTRHLRTKRPEREDYFLTFLFSLPPSRRSQ